MDTDEDPIRVLHVDDERTVAETMRETAAEATDRLSVTVATDVDEALETLAQERYDCVVSDYDMPGRSGMDLLQAIRTDHPDLPFIFYTGTTDQTLAREALSAGATDYLPKAIDTDGFDLLLRRIESVVARQDHPAITELAERTTLLEAERNRWRSLFENLGEPVVEVVFDGEAAQVQRVNDAFESVFGYDEETILGEDLDPLIVPEDDREEARELNVKTVEGTPAEHELVRQTADGLRPFLLRTVPFTVDGEPHGYAIYLDISQRVAHRQKLTALHDVADELARSESVQAVCEHAIEASEDILAFDLSIIDLVEGDVLEPMALSADMTTDDIAAMDLDEGIAGHTFTEQRSFLIDDIQELDEADPQGPYHSAISVPIGEHGIFQAVSEDRNDFDDTDLELAELLVSHVESALDRLDRERQLERQNERLDEYTSIVSHDLRNPLNVAQGRLDLARDTSDSEHLEQAAQAIDRSLALIDDLLTFAQEGEAANDLDDIDLAETVKRCWTTVETGDGTLNIETDVTIRGDPRRVKQLLENLIRNAVEHGGETVTVTVGDLENGFYIADDGQGFDRVDPGRLFEAGYSTSDKGSGLGLSIVREIVEAHDWSISVTESDAGGARFEIRDVTYVSG